MIIHRRAFLTGLIAAPVIVKAASLMPVRKVLLRPPLVGEARVIREDELIQYWHMADLRPRYRVMYEAMRPGLEDAFNDYPADRAEWAKVFS